MKLHRHEDDDGATFINQQQAFHYHKWVDVVTL